jgi:hypothetical protein
MPTNTALERLNVLEGLGEGSCCMDVLFVCLVKLALKCLSED